MSDAGIGTIAAMVAIGVPATTGEDDLPATLASLYGSAAATGRAIEVIVAVNGPGEPAPAVAGVEAFARAQGLPFVPAGAAPPSDGSCVRLLRLAPQSKVAAWNAIRDAARAPIIVFADADVRVAPAASLVRQMRYRSVPTGCPRSRFSSAAANFSASSFSTALR